MRKPTIHFASMKQTGNIYWIMGAVRDALRKQRRISEWNDLYQEILNSGSYEEALGKINKLVHLIDDDDVYQFE